MLFKLENRSSEKHTHCGVLEFISDEGLVYMPYWVRTVFWVLGLNSVCQAAWSAAIMGLS